MRWGGILAVCWAVSACAGPLEDRYLHDGEWTLTLDFVLDTDANAGTVADQYSVNVESRFAVAFDETSAESADEWPYAITEGQAVSVAGGGWHLATPGRPNCAPTDELGQAITLATGGQTLDVDGLRFACVAAPGGSNLYLVAFCSWEVATPDEVNPSAEPTCYKAGDQTGTRGAFSSSDEIVSVGGKFVRGEQP